MTIVTGKCGHRVLFQKARPFLGKWFAHLFYCSDCGKGGSQYWTFFNKTDKPEDKA